MPQASETTCKALGMAVLVSLVASAAYGQGIVRGKLMDKWGNTLANVSVLAEPVSNDKDGRNDRPKETTTDEKGQYVLAGMFATEYLITYRLAGYQGVRFRVRPTSQFGANSTTTHRQDFEMDALPPGGKLRGKQTFEAEGGVPKISFDEDGTFKFEDVEGDGEGTYGVVELTGMLTVRDYDGPDDKYSIMAPFNIGFTNDRFTSFSWGDATLMKK